MPTIRRPALLASTITHSGQLGVVGQPRTEIELTCERQFRIVPEAESRGDG
jgi:hypothetical protein